MDANTSISVNQSFEEQLLFNGTAQGPFPMEAVDGSIFDRPAIRNTFVLLYSIVFVLCVFGNLTVVLVVTLHWKMRNMTKFCLGNLAFSNFCVGIFCVYQNLSTFLIERWVFGRFLCKMYHFTNSLSHTASILILVVMAVERYMAILHPFRFRQLLTMTKLRGLHLIRLDLIFQLTIVGVWLISAILCSPRLYYITTYKIPSPSSKEETTVKYDVICAPQRNLYDSLTADMINFILLFLVPLAIITLLYARVGLVVWRRGGTVTTRTRNACDLRVNEDSMNSEVLSANGQSLNTVWSRLDTRRELKKRTCRVGIIFTRRCFRKRRRQKNIRIPPDPEGRVELSSNRRQSLVENAQSQLNNQTSTSKRASRWLLWRTKRRNRKGFRIKRVNTMTGVEATQSNAILQSRKTVIRVLIASVISFALCNLPFHLRKICQYYMKGYDFGSNSSYLITSTTFLIMYTNCAINPLLYAFLSKNFRRSLRDVLRFRTRRRAPQDIIS